MNTFKIFTANAIYTYQNNMTIKHFIISTVFLSFFSFCKLNSEHKSTAQTTAQTPLYPIDEGTKGVAAKRWPETPVSDLVKGLSIYNANCSKCHELPKIEQFSERKWLHEIDEMAPKAELSTSQKDLLSKYVLSFRESHSMQ